MTRIPLPRLLPALLLTLLGSGLTQQAQAQNCNRSCMGEVLDDYLQALTSNAPDQAPLATTYRHTENDVVQVLGEGLWKTATGLGAMQRQYFDEVSDQAVYYGTLYEGAAHEGAADEGGADGNGPLAVVAVRVHITNKQVDEAEWWIGRESDPGINGEPGTTLWDPEYLTNGNSPLVRTVPRAERSTRDELIYMTNSYWDYVVDRNPNIVAAHPGCYREENGRKTVGNPMPAERPDDGGLDGLTDCRTGSNNFNVANVTARRWHVVDVEQQVVVASALFIREPGNNKRRNHFCDVFYIDNGKIRGLYTAMYYVPPTRAVPNWAPFPGNFPLAESFGDTH